MRWLASILLFVCLGPASAQDTTTYGQTEADTGAYYVEEDLSGKPSSGESDTINVEARAFAKENLERLHADSDLNYTQAPTVGESLLERFMNWLNRLFNEAMGRAFTTAWGKLLLYALGLAVIVYVVMMLLRVDAFRMLFSKPSVQQYQVLDENIHEMDFEALIREAIEQNDFRKAVRLLFLQSLKLLSDRALIHWQPGKTNHEYAAELNDKELKPGFNELNYYFDYVWYGNFSATHALFERAKNTFSNWRKKLS